MALTAYAVGSPSSSGPTAKSTRWNEDRKMPIKLKKASASVSCASNETIADSVADVVHKIENMNREEAITKIGELCNIVDKTYFEVGGALFVVQINGWFAPYPSFKDFVEQSIGIRYRKAVYLVEIYEAMANVKIEWSKFQHLGWTKMRRLAKVVNAANADEWIKIATEHTSSEIEELVRKHLAGELKATKGSKPEHSKTLKFHADQFEIVNKAIERAREQSGTKYDSAAFELICMDYLAGYSLEENLAHLSPDGLAIELGKVFKKFDEDMLLTILKKALVGHDLNPEAIADEADALMTAE